MKDHAAVLRELMARAEADATLRAELQANPRAVFTRETGISAMEVEQALNDSELKTITGGLDVGFEDNWRKCSDCGFECHADLMLAHRFLVHGKFLWDA